MALVAILALLACVLQAYGWAPAPTARSTAGFVQGKTISTSRGNCDVFLGVPFAAPPVGDLRWQKPKAPQSWGNTMRDATKFAPRCIQTGSNGTNPAAEESEDCLYLNVIGPSTTDRRNQNLPIMVYIHGGAFESGSAQWYKPEGVCENLASRGVLVVIIQYRLFLYGFLSTGDNEAAGNYALWDQIGALNWLKLNALDFGGNPNKITIFGESAGGGSVSYHTYLPTSQSYFQQSISQSGSSFSPLGKPNELSSVTTRQLAQAANCPTNSKDIVKCLKALSTVQLQKVYNTMIPPAQQNYFFQWNFRVDGDLFKSDELKELGLKKPAIIGINSVELPGPDVNQIPIAEQVWAFTLNLIFSANDTVPVRILKNLTQYHYLDSQGNSADKTFIIQQVNKLQGDANFAAPSAAEAESKAAAGTPTWVYKFDFYYDGMYPPNYPFEKGTPHEHDLCYLFLGYPTELGKATLNKCPTQFVGNYRKVADYFGEMWTNFAKTGNPSSKDLVWPQFQNVLNANALHIRPNLKVENFYELAPTKYWNSLIPNIVKTFEEAAKGAQ